MAVFGRSLHPISWASPLELLGVAYHPTFDDCTPRVRIVVNTELLESLTSPQPKDPFMPGQNLADFVTQYGPSWYFCYPVWAN